jgi:hypothetical protein
MMETALIFCTGWRIFYSFFYFISFFLGGQGQGRLELEFVLFEIIFWKHQGRSNRGDGAVPGIIGPSKPCGGSREAPSGAA